MNTELTKDMIEDGIKCGTINCTICKMYIMCNEISQRQFNSIILQALKTEKEKPKVWDEAPADAKFASVQYCLDAGKPYPKFSVGRTSYFHYRELPKTKARLIAEKWAYNASIDPDFVRIEKTNLSDLIEKAILEAKGDI